MENWFINLMGVVGLGSALIIIALVTLRSVLEVAHMFNFLPTRWQRLFVDREEKAVQRVLERTGLIHAVPQLKELRAWIDIDVTELSKTFRVVAKRMIETTVVEGDHVIGRDVNLHSRYYIALREKLTNFEYASSAARVVAAFVKDEIQKSEAEIIEYDAVAGIRDGSPVFVSILADLVRRPCILVGERRYVKRRESDTEPVVETIQLAGIRSAIIVDDSSTDGYMMMNAVNALRSCGINVKHAFVIFRRSEGDAAEVLAQIDVRLHAIAVVGVADVNSSCLTIAV